MLTALESSTPSSSINRNLLVEAQTGVADTVIQRQLGRTSRIMISNTHYCALPSLAPICVGHVLILPRFSCTNIATAVRHNTESLHSVLRQLRASGLYEDGLYFFEHGIYGRAAARCGVSHAHLHLIPRIERLIPHALARLATQNAVRLEATSLSGLKDLNPQAGEKSYLLIGKYGADARVAFGRSIESQLVRKVAHALGLDCAADWKDLGGWDKMLKTLQLSRSAIDMRKTR